MSASGQCCGKHKGGKVYNMRSHVKERGHLSKDVEEARGGIVRGGTLQTEGTLGGTCQSGQEDWMAGVSGEGVARCQ